MGDIERSTPPQQKELLKFPKNNKPSTR